MLPSVLPYTPASAESEERELAASSRWKATISVAGTSLSSDLVSLSLGAIETSFSAATDDDQALLSAYENISDIPAYLLDMVAEISVGDQTVQTSAASLGSSSSWGLAIASPTRSYNITNTLTWGAPFSVAMERQPLAAEENLTMEVSSSFPHCLFNQAVSTYISDCASDDEELAAIFGLSLTRGTQEASVGLSITPKCVSGVAVSTTSGGAYIDADLSTATPAGLTKATRKGFTLTSGLSGSAHEHLVLEECFEADAISTARAISLANSCEVPVVTLTSANWATLAPALELPAYIKAQMEDAVQAGYAVTTPTQEVGYIDFIGEGWIVTDPVTGEGAYLISGGYSGGKVVESRQDEEANLMADWYESIVSAVNIISPDNGSNFLKGEDIMMTVNYHLIHINFDKPDLDYQTTWKIETKKECYLPGTYLLTAKAGPAGFDTISVNLFGLLRAENDYMWASPDSVQNLQAQAVSVEGTPIDGLISSGNDELTVETSWEWNEESYAKNARFLDSEEKTLSSVLDSDGSASVNVRMGEEEGRYIAWLSTACQYFISWDDKGMFLKERYPEQCSLTYEIYVVQGVTSIIEAEIRVLDNRNVTWFDLSGSSEETQSSIEGSWNSRVEWGQVAGIVNSGQERLNDSNGQVSTLKDIVIGVRLNIEENGDQTGEIVSADASQTSYVTLPVNLSSHRQCKYDLCGSMEDVEILLAKVPNAEFDEGNRRTIFFTSQVIDPCSKDDSDGVYFPQTENEDDVNEFTVINAFSGLDYFGTFPGLNIGGCRESHVKFTDELEDEGWTSANYVNVNSNKGLAWLKDNLGQPVNMKDLEALTYGKEVDFAEKFNAVNLLRAGGGAEVLQATLSIANCQVDNSSPQVDKILVKNPVDWIYIQGHGNYEQGCVAVGRSKDDDGIFPPMLNDSNFQDIEKTTNGIPWHGRNLIEWYRNRAPNELFVGCLADVEAIFLVSCDATMLGGLYFDQKQPGIEWMSTGVRNILGYYTEVGIMTFRDVVTRFFSLESDSILTRRWISANQGDNNYKASAIGNPKGIDLDFLYLDDSHIFFGGYSDNEISSFCVLKENEPKWVSVEEAFSINLGSVERKPLEWSWNTGDLWKTNWSYHEP